MFERFDYTEYENHLAFNMLSLILHHEGIKSILQELALKLINATFVPIKNELNKVSCASDLPKDYYFLIQEMVAEQTCDKRQYGAIYPNLSKKDFSSIIC